MIEPPAAGHGWHTVADLLDAYERSREFSRLAPRTRTDYLKGLVDVRARCGSAPLGIVNSVALKGNVLDWIEVRWAGKGADKRLDPFKFALCWATGRHPERVPVNYLHGIPRFYEGADRAEIIWEDAEVDLFCRRAPEAHADAVRLARETGLRIGDLVELERSEIRRAPDGNDLRGTKVTEMVWSGISVPDLAIRIGWKIETAAKMLGVYAALNPGRATVLPLSAPARQDDTGPVSPRS